VTAGGQALRVYIIMNLEIMDISVHAQAKRYELDLVKSSMHLTIDLPPDISEVLQGRWGDVSRRALEAVAVETYRTGVLSESQIKRLLGFENRLQFHALLKEHRVPYRYSELDLQDDLAVHRELGILSNR
jgi:predicted HTH domain antitoxin